jgi:hypothetical protein
VDARQVGAGFYQRGYSFLQIFLVPDAAHRDFAGCGRHLAWCSQADLAEF